MAVCEFLDFGVVYRDVVVFFGVQSLLKVEFLSLGVLVLRLLRTGGYFLCFLDIWIQVLVNII